MEGFAGEDPARATGRLAEILEGRGDAEGAAEARRLAERIQAWERQLRDRMGGVLSIHHDMSNALTGVLGNAQLLLMGTAAKDPKTRRRLEQLQQEAERLREMAERLGQARTELRSETEPDAEERSA